MTDNANNPVSDYPSRLSAFVRPQSGGHDHDINRPTGKFITRGSDTLANFRDTTDSKGKLTYTYICSGFGGVDSIFVRGRSDRDTSSATILLRFDGLQELTEGDHYVLIGAYGEEDVTSEHYKNHYGTINLVSRLQAVADTIYARKGYKLRINDVSLANGGPFDLNNDWETPHQTHRNGISVDIRNSLTDGTSAVTLTRRQLVRWLGYSGLEEGADFRVRKEAGHYHVTVY